MIKECYVTQTGIKFDHAYLKELGFNLLKLAHQLEAKGLDLPTLGFDIAALEDLAEKAKGRQAPLEMVQSPIQTHPQPGFGALIQHARTIPLIHDPFLAARARTDALAKIWDQLILSKVWWALEVLPMLATYQLGDWTWVQLWAGEVHPVHDDQVKIHRSVEKRIEETVKGAVPYKPQAYNWDQVQDSGMLTYVD